MKIFVTGIAGMIGYHVAQHLTELGHLVWGIDDFNDYYSPRLKLKRKSLLQSQGVSVYHESLADVDYGFHFHSRQPDVVVHLAAYTNPRHSLSEPQLYIDVNISGTQRLIKYCEKYHVHNVIYASSSCVMEGQPLPYSELDRPDVLTNPYAWTKRANECQFSHSRVAQSVGLRFFTVYGPWGRPDMALFLFTDGIVRDYPVVIYNNGHMSRDFTYVGDAVQSVEIMLNRMMGAGNVSSHEIYNVGSGVSTPLMKFLQEIEHNLGRRAQIDFQPRHPGDVEVTLSDISRIQALGYQPSTSIEQGVSEFVRWYVDYHTIRL
jgi:UDP-glucuronate 4-epimerase